MLIVAPSWIGDMIMAQPLLANLSGQGYQIDMLALPWIKLVLGRMANIHDVIDMPIGHGQLQFGLRRQIGRSLKSRGYTRAIVLPNTLKSALIPFFASIPKRIGFHGEMRVGLLNDRRQLQPEVMPRLVQRYYSLGLDRNAALPEKIPYPELMVSEAQLERTLNEMQMQRPVDPVVALCPGAEYGAAKRWPEAHYAEVAQAMLDAGRQVWLFGSEKDQQVCQAIDEMTGSKCLNLAGTTRLDQAIDLMSLSEVVVTNDSGLMHVACALGRRVVALFGSTSPDYTPPLSDDANILSLNLPCSPCFQRECPLGHLDCLQKLSPTQVIGAILH